jgi:predicted NBD/HSP70 family sugar kinase
MRIVAGIDLGGTAINYTFLTATGSFLVETLCEHPSRAKDGPELCLRQIVDGLERAADIAGVSLADVDGVGLDTPGPASADGVLSARGSTNFLHPDWKQFDLRAAVWQALKKPVAYLNDGNAAALWGHVETLGTASGTSITAIIGTGLGGGVVIDGNVISGRRGFGGEVGHVLLPYRDLTDGEALSPLCNCGRVGDLESLCSLTAIETSLLPAFLRRYPNHELHRITSLREAAKLVRGLAENGDEMCRSIFRLQARALGLFFDQMINVFDPDVLLVGGGALEADEGFQRWFLEAVRGGMPRQREEQASIPLRRIPNGDTASARGAAIHALNSLGS